MDRKAHMLNLGNVMKRIFCIIGIVREDDGRMKKMGIEGR